MNPHKIIGFVSHNRKKTAMLCDGDACLVFGSGQKLKDYTEKRAIKEAGVIKTARLDEILEGLKLGGVYQMDEEAYSRFQNEYSTGGSIIEIIQQEVASEQRFYRLSHTIRNN